MKARWSWRGWSLRGGATVLLFICSFLVGLGSDWPQYRGDRNDGISTDRLNKQWRGSVTNPVWRVLLTNGLGSIVVCDGRLFTQGVRNFNGTNKETCVALSAKTGSELWATPLDNIGYPGGGVGFDDGPRSTPSVKGDSVYILTSFLKLYRLNATNGAVIWLKDLKALYGGIIIPWQNAASPIIEGDYILVNANCTLSTLMALRTSNGSIAWRSLDETTTHSTPVVAEINGVRQVIFATTYGLVSVHPQSGGLLWRFPYQLRYSISLGASPVVYSNFVFITGAHAYGMGSMVVRANYTSNTWAVTKVWATNNPAAHWMTPVCHDGFLYGQFGIQAYDSARAQLKCVDIRTGVVKWSTNEFGRSSTLLVDNHVVSLTERGQLVLVKPSTNVYTELGRFTANPFYTDATNKCWNSPAVCDGRIYVRGTAYVTAFDLSLPDLEFAKPARAPDGSLQLTVQTVDGMAVDSNRLAAVEVRTSTDITQPLNAWTVLTNRPSPSNGVVRIEINHTGTPSRQYFIVREQN